VRLVRVGARAARRLPDPAGVARLERGADDGVPAPESTRPAGVGLGAGIAVIADGAVRPGSGVAAVAGLVAHPRVAGVSRRRAIARSPTADTRGAGVVHGAEETIIAGRAVGLVRVGTGTVRRIADPGDVALVARGADDGVGPDAAARLAGVGLRAGIAVGAGAAVGLVRVGAGAARRVAASCRVALVQGGADDGVSPGAGVGLAGVGVREGFAVGAGAAVRLVGVGADAARRIAGAGDVALVEDGAHDGVHPDAGASLAGVGLGAGITIGARAAVGLVRVGAGAARRIADAGVVALVERGADDGVRSRAGARLAGVGLRAGIAVGASDAVGQDMMLAARPGRAAVGRARVAVVAVRRGAADAAPGRAPVVRRAGVAVVAGRRVVRVHAADRRIAGVVRARVIVVAAERWPTDAGAVRALVGGGARAPVVTTASVEARHLADARPVAGAVVGADVPVVARRFGGLELAGRRAAVAVQRVAVVALLARVEEAVAADRSLLP